MEGLLIVGLIAVFAFWSPESDKKLTRATKRKIKNEQQMDRSPQNIKKAGEQKSTDSSK